MRKIYVSTIAPDAAEAAKQYGVGLEIAEYCTAWNMDEKFAETDDAVRKKLDGIQNRILHAPFNELFPCAIDPKARALAAERYMQAARLARHYGAEKLVIHGGYNPRLYYPEWYIEQSVVFWKDFLRNADIPLIVLENVLEESPEMLLEIVKGTDDPRLRLCLDVGHANAWSKVPVSEWLTALSPWISHFHIHNNDGTWDTHSELNSGSIPMKAFLQQADIFCPAATYTLEVMQAELALRWLEAEKIWN